jgi:transcriptional regulator with AAA-type ATPase domain/NAD-dependent dihydropyrimidine dehydrogenase PreA subunit
MMAIGSHREVLAMTQEITDWLRHNTSLGTLSDATLGAIAQAIQIQPLAENRRLILEDTPPPALVILHSGRLERYRTTQTTPALALSLLPGTILHLKELLLDQPTECTVITLSDCILWTIPRAEFLTLVQHHPDISQTFSRQLSTELEQLSAQLAYERERQTVLRPYLVPKVKRGIVGTSRYAVRYRQEIKQAAGDRQSVLVFGEPGLEKDNTAALIHFGSRDRLEPLIKVNCDTIQANGADLFGRAGGKPGLLAWVGTGTLLLNNLQDLPTGLQTRLITLLQTGTYVPIAREGEAPPPPRQSEARIMMVAEKVLPGLDRKGLVGHTIKVPPLRVRKTDIATQLDYYLSLISRARGVAKPSVTPEAIRRLQSYDFPGNITELEGLVERAMIQANGATTLTEEVFWETNGKGRQFRWNVLNAYPKLRQLLRSPWYPTRINYGVTLVVFAAVVGILLFGPQTRDRNIGLNLFWAWWWLASLLIFPFLGRIWCSFCPFMIYGELVQTLSLKLWPRTLRSWPRQNAEAIGGWFVFGLFALILLWEELWNLENTAYLSGCLLLLITAGAVIFSVLFERRFWCRYLCPIGGMNGLFAKLSMTELRAQQGICSASCTTYQCYKGGPQKGEGQETLGCPLYSHPAQLQDNRDCVLCMTCLKACPHRSVELNLRPPGIELWTTHTPSWAEVCLMFLLAGAVVLHHLSEGSQRWGWNLPLTEFGWHTGGAIAALLVPGAIALVAHGLFQQLTGRGVCKRPFKVLAYGYLPLVLGANLAHYWHLGLTEAGRVIPVTAATFGWGVDPGQGTSPLLATLPTVVAHPAVITFLQGSTLLGASLASVLLTVKIARLPMTKVWPQYGAIGAIALLFWQLVVGH